VNDTATSPTPDLSAFRPGTLVFMGLLSMLAGILALGAPLVVGTTATMLVGIALLVGGLFETVTAFSASPARSRFASLLGGLLSVVCGGLVLARPLLGLAVLTLVLAAYFLVDGLLRIALAFQLKPLRGWGLTLVGGFVTCLLAAMIWSKWPLSGVWAIGTLVGIRLLFSGGSLLALGSLAGKAEPAA